MHIHTKAMIKYKNKEIYEVTIASTLSQYKGSHIDNDIVLLSLIHI